MKRITQMYKRTAAYRKELNRCQSATCDLVNVTAAQTEIAKLQTMRGFVEQCDDDALRTACLTALDKQIRDVASEFDRAYYNE